MVRSLMDLYRTITMCGSTNFRVVWEYVITKLIEQGYYVHSVEIWENAYNVELDSKYIGWLDRLHKWKIDNSFAIYVVDVSGYIGYSTQAEIRYARMNSKTIYYYSLGDLLE